MDGEASERPQRGGARARERREETRERIFRAAIELFAAQGHADVTIRQIVKRAEIGHGTFFNYFASKEAILTYFGAMQVERMQQALEEGEIPETPREGVLRVMQVMAEYPGLTPDLARGMFIAALRGPAVTEVQGPSIWHMQGIIVRLLVRGEQEGHFHLPYGSEEAALFVLGQYFLALLTWCSGFTSHSLAETVRRYVGTALDGLAAPQQ